jgi:hypothetical protein
MTDAEYVLAQLRSGPRDAMQVISASIRDRGVGLTVHSRVADLRAQGYTITCGIEGKTRKGRDRYLYRLCGEPAPPPPPEPAPPTPEPAHTTHQQLALTLA